MSKSSEVCRTVWRSPAGGRLRPTVRCNALLGSTRLRARLVGNKSGRSSAAIPIDPSPLSVCPHPQTTLLDGKDSWPLERPDVGNYPRVRCWDELVFPETNDCPVEPMKCQHIVRGFIQYRRAESARGRGRCLDISESHRWLRRVIAGGAKRPRYQQTKKKLRLHGLVSAQRPAVQLQGPLRDGR